MDYKKPLKDQKLVPENPIVNQPIVWGIVSLLFFLGFFLIWSVFFPLDKAAIAQGQIEVDTENKLIQHLEGGIIKQILVNDGMVVKQDQVLMILDDTQSKARRTQAYNQYLELLAQEARLLAEKEKSPIIKFPEQIIKLKDDDKVKQLIISQQAIFDDNKKNYEAMIGSLQKKIGFYQSQITELQEQVSADNDRFTYSEKELEAAKKLIDKKFISQSDLWRLHQAAMLAKSDMNEHKAQISQANQQLVQTQIQISSTDEERQKTILSDLDKTQKDISQALEQYNATQDILTRIVIRAPLAGTIVNLKYHTVGGVIRSGDTIMELVPKNDKLIIVAKLKPIDIDMVHVGMRAKIQLTAFSIRRTPMVLGTVTEVSADAIEDTRTGEYHYKIRVTVDKGQLAKLSHVFLFPGMPAQVSLIVDQRSFFDYLITPLLSSFDRSFSED